MHSLNNTEYLKRGEFFDSGFYLLTVYSPSKKKKNAVCLFFYLQSTIHSSLLCLKCSNVCKNS